MNKKNFLKKKLTIGLLLAGTVLILLYSYTLKNFPLLIFGLLVFSSIFFLTNLIKRIKNYLKKNNISYLDITLENQDKYEIPVKSHQNNLASMNGGQTISKFIKNNNLLVE